MGQVRVNLCEPPFKYCGGCRQARPVGEFHRGQKRCKPCMKTYRKRAKPRRNITAGPEQKDRKRVLVQRLGGICNDCHQVFPDVCYDFHHLRDKRFTISQGMGRAWLELVDEAEKCVLLCANCHRLRHYG